MTREDIALNVKEYYWHDDINCATTTLKILAKNFDITLDKQVIDCAIGMHGAGEYGAQCGLVEGTLMFLGLYGRAKEMPQKQIVQNCKAFAKAYEEDFKSLLCSELRPEGFKEENPPHLCEPLTNKAVQFSIDFVQKIPLNKM